ncbi:SusC/RagA family TonB-linked outer membrane protein [Chryseolinea lacunae]|uniref:TonB-dependent receptor n=1 Tax=Chryseolinea lacunae TaxID=2801331 RepID=A0ABS1KXP9_9BACT|nr:TonB-dependent receptor [Chryseolinea lacunae]MBL0744110.1 TonB-dependent receptor [Chryseolinea lacunae]
MKKLYKRVSLSLAAMLMLLASVALAQERVVTGTVADESGNTMPGVNVILKGTAKGTVTDADGKFSLPVPGDNAVLLITFVGYGTTEVQVGTQTSIEVNMQPDLTSLDEVVVTGYSIDKRRELTGSVSTVKTKDLTVSPTGNVEQLLQGRVAGVTVITNGQPGTTSQIRVRGFGGFKNNQPLYVVDGVPTDDVSFLNPDDIETTTVLKDAASASIYGARAASGVIVYTTKKGKKGQKLNVTYDNMFGYSLPGKGLSMMNPQDFADWTWNAIKNTENANAAAANRAPNYAQAIADFKHPQFGTGLTPVIPDYINVGGTSGVVGAVNLDAEFQKYNVDPRNGSIYQVVAANKSGTDWYKEITGPAPVFRQTLGVAGGGDTHRFYIGLSQQSQEGILKNNSFKRYAVRANSEFDVLPNLRFGENLQFTLLQRLGLSGGDGGRGIAADENDILSAFRMPSIIPVYDVFGGYAGTAAKGFNNPRNPVAARDGQGQNSGFQPGGFGNIYLELDVVPGLTLRTSIGGSYSNYFYRNFTRWQYENSENNSAFGYQQGQGYTYSYTFTNTASYKKTFGDHGVEVLLGQEALNIGNSDDETQNGLNPFVWDPDYINITATNSRQANGAFVSGVRFASLFGSVKYSFKEKYILSGVVRRDGSSVFSANNRYGVFPAVSAAWRISAEPFMQSMSFISDLKIRGGWGVMGNSKSLDPNNSNTLFYGTVGNSGYDIGGTNSSANVGFYRTRIGNQDTKWEENVTTNIGIDGQFFGGKLDVIIDFWKKDTKGLLYEKPIVASVGTGAQVPSVNAARMLNRGIDIFLGNKGTIATGLGYEVAFSGSFLHNEISSIGDGETYLTTVNPGFRGINPIRNQLGQSISAFYGYKVVGLFHNAEEVSAAPTQSGAAPGRFRYADLSGPNGVPDGVIDDKDRTFLGSPVPKFTGGFNFTLRYSNFDLAVYLYASLGNKIFNQSRWFTDFYPSFQGAAISNRVKDSWTPTNTEGSIPVFESASNFSTNTQSNSFYVENGSYLRMQNITLGYTVPQAVLDRLKMTKLRFYISANNLFTITGYSGLDPAVGGAADTNFGIDVGNYPVTKGFTGGLNIAF